MSEEIDQLKFEVANLKSRLAKLEGIKPISPVKVGKFDTDITEIQLRVCKYFSISLQAMLGKSRLAHTVKARHVAMYIAYKKVRKYSRVGRAFKRDHTSIIFVIKKMEHRVTVDKELCGIIEDLNKKLVIII